MKKRKLNLVIFALIFVLLTGCSSNNATTSSESSDEKVQDGGTLNIAFQSEPTTLDPQITGNSSTKDVARNIFETLVTLDEKGNPVPDLAKTIKISNDQKVYTFQLHQGVKFHNGKELTADDVVASINRWIKLSSLGKTNFTDAKMVKTGKYSVELHLKTANINTLALLADPIPAAAIYPKEIIEKAPDAGATEYIGTGPFKVKEWKQNQYIILEKFADYSSKDRKIKKDPHLDEIKISFLTDESTRISGLTTGQFDIALGISSDNAAQIESTQTNKNELSPGGFLGLFYNTQAGFFKDIHARKAVNAVINSEDILSSSYGNSDYYELTSSIVNKKYPNYYSEAGKEEYNQHDKDKAKEYLKEAGYKGEEIKILTSRDYEDQYNTAVVVQQELEDIGVKVKLEVYDWATFGEKLTDPATWDLYATSWAARSTIFQGFWTTWGAPVKEAQPYLDAIKSATSIEEAQPAIDAAQKYVWDTLPFTLIGHKKSINAVSNKVQGYGFNLGPVFYNISLTK
ncbi:ABC transporter substrate-binding protein [Niallia nealsonii]|uniref:ABC transporter substrate-binding protein n=1 Tax=Niallia nealsonii TaxID=115979 RepID=A0A2N0YY86_9BACI|nr:ABC transporter substrate-binding protein [Niallia nealsonii]PKG22220.1 ABC transporter substrate-binding protein [Niallia nealsonii]